MTHVAPAIRGLDDLSNPPNQVYYRGLWDKAIFTKCAAVVGSRRMTQYGRMVVEKLVPQLVQEGFTIVSGFMYGVDQAAHRACLECGGRTIAVLGWGINWRDFDQEDATLLKEIEKNGLVISEWEDQKPSLWTFPLRNRIVAAIAQEVFIVEAAIKSGALITARIASKLKRTIWAVPGPITSGVSEGTNQLIAAGLARIWLPRRDPRASSAPSNNPIVRLLETQALDASGIARSLCQPIDTIGAQLSLLVLSGDIIEREGTYYVS
jgi:DNA processing protein